MKKILALVLARKGSVRLKNKNILKLINKSLIEWTFETINKKGIRKLFTDVLVSTDSNKILILSKKYDFITPWLRPKKISTRYTSSAESALHAIDWYEKNIQKLDGVFLFQPTSPFRNEKKIFQAVKLFEKTNNQIVSVASKRIYKFKKNDVNGSIYITSVNHLKKYKTFVKPKFRKIEMKSEIENTDIDTIEDFNKAKLLYKTLNKKKCL